MDILNPPKSYIMWRCAIHSWEVDFMSNREGYDIIKKKFLKNNGDLEEEISSFIQWLERARKELNLPIEQIELREADGKKHGDVRRMMIWDIQYWLDGGEVKFRKIYIPAPHIDLRLEFLETGKLPYRDD